MRYVLIVAMLSSLYADDFYYEFGKKVKIVPVKNDRTLQVYKPQKRYITQNGNIVSFKHEIIVKLKNGIDKDDFFSRFSIYNYKKISSNRYIIYPSVDKNIFELAQILYESGETVYAIPNKIKRYKKR